MTEKPFSEMNFNQMVDDVAGRALISLIQGKNWRSIIWQVCNECLTWKGEVNKAKEGVS